MIKRITMLFIFFFALYVLHFTLINAADKEWSGSGDGSTWSDDDNWSPAVAPASIDNATIDIEGASITCTATFNAESITVGGRENVTLTSNNFIFGTVSPDSSSDTAVFVRNGGKLVLKNSGVLTLKGQYKDSEESLTPEPSFMFWIE